MFFLGGNPHADACKQEAGSVRTAIPVAICIRVFSRALKVLPEKGVQRGDSLVLILTVGGYRHRIAAFHI